MLKNLRYIITVICMLTLLLVAKPVWAHLMLIEPVEEGQVRVFFDDGTIARQAELVVYDEDQEEITSGKVDAEGKFTYPPDDAELIVANDAFGHRTEYVVGAELESQLPRGSTIVIVLIGCAIVAVIFQYRVSARNRK